MQVVVKERITVLSKFGSDRITVNRSLRRSGAMGWPKHSIPTGLSVIKSDLHFGEARDAAMKSDAAMKE